MEVLSRLLSEYRNLNLFKGIKIARNAPEVSHLFFADDTFLFCRATKEDVLTIQAAIELFSDITWQQINFEKSGAYFSRNVDQEHKGAVLAVLGIQEMRNNASYLETTLLQARAKIKNFQHLLKRIGNKMATWKVSNLSFAGWEVLMKSVLQSQPIYLMQCFRFPKTVCRTLDTACQRFWLGKPNKIKQMTLISWDRCWKPKNQGGLGFKRMEQINSALLLKQGWRLLNQPNSLWGEIIKAKYYPKTSFFDTKVQHKNGSWIWKSITSITPLLHTMVKRKIGDGNNTYFWFDPWVDSTTDHMVGDFNTIIGQRQATVREVYELQSNRAANQQNITGQIPPLLSLSIYAINPTPTMDSWLLLISTTGEFTAKLTGIALAKINSHDSVPNVAQWWRNAKLMNNKNINPIQLLNDVNRWIKDQKIYPNHLEEMKNNDINSSTSCIICLMSQTNFGNLPTLLCAGISSESQGDRWSVGLLENGIVKDLQQGRAQPGHLLKILLETIWIVIRRAIQINVQLRYIWCDQTLNKHLTKGGEISQVSPTLFPLLAMMIPITSKLEVCNLRQDTTRDWLLSLTAGHIWSNYKDTMSHTRCNLCLNL